ncbi:DUF4843 domain-containing protein [Sphingobacterium sp. SGG-5]|uniref:DUF4843 domain-containing protein n=1 Tax=Sphingobacterium sp. SGG-5 TaxID=2710881 RepID=UPI0013EBE52D|nr:DUF4843 domain-containing protein [Sphingobacterium sp. SGG-5]NGM60427.1 DUF4843 domain-containing protein [Sphingobacterium sp. SGG-5]
MRRIYIIMIAAITLGVLGGCFKDYNERYFVRDNRVEFQDAVVNSNTGTLGFPILPAVLGDAVGKVRFRINMTGEQKDYDRTVNFRVIPESTTARAGIEYNLPQDSFVIPANSSFGWVEVEILPEGSGNRVIALELLETGDITVMKRYNRIGFRVLYYSSSPEPGTVEQINDITYFNTITFGGQSNTEIGNYIDLLTGDAYVIQGANVNQDNIDLVYMVGASTRLNFISPSDDFAGWGGAASHIVNDWTIRNHGTLVRWQGPTPEEVELFDNAESVADLMAAFVQARTTAQDRPGHNATNHGPGSRVQLIDVEDIVLFYSPDRNVVAMIKIIGGVGSADGDVVLEIKSGQVTEDPNAMHHVAETTLGPQASTSVAGMIDLLTGNTYFRDSCPSCSPQSTPAQETIDLIYAYGGSGLNSLYTPMGIDPAFTQYSYIAANWTKPNNGLLVRLVNPTAEELAMYADAQSVADLMRTFEHAVGAAPGRSYAGYDPATYTRTTHGPGVKVLRLEVGELVAYYSPDRNLVAVIKVNNLHLQGGTAAVNRRIDIEIKSGQFGPL